MTTTTPPTIRDLLEAAPPPSVLAKSSIMFINDEFDNFTHRQAVWGTVGTCGTYCCIAGFIALEVGCHPVTIHGRLGLELVGPEPDLNPLDPGCRDSSTVAQIALGLDDDDAYWLFAPARTKTQARDALASIAEGRPFERGDD